MAVYKVHRPRYYRPAPQRSGGIGRIAAGVVWTVLLLAVTAVAVGLADHVWRDRIQAFLTPHIATNAVPTTYTVPGTNAVPTAYVAPAAPITAVTPQVQYRTQPTVAAMPTEIAPAILSQGATSYALITTPPTPYPTPVCDAAHPAFMTDPVKVLDTKGIPIGEVQGWSCDSEAAAVTSARTLSEAMIAQHKAQP